MDDEVTIGGTVYNEGGLVVVNQNLSITGTNANGYSYWQDTAASAKLLIQAPLFASGTLQIDLGSVTLTPFQTNGYLLVGNGLNFGDDDPTSLNFTGGPGNAVANISGPVTLGQQTTTTLSFSGANNTTNLIFVSGTLTLDGTLVLSSADFPTQKPTQTLAFFQATTINLLMDPINGNFTSIQDGINNNDTGAVVLTDPSGLSASYLVLIQ